MAISFFDKTLTKQHGISNEIICPVCSKKVSMMLFESIDISPVAAFLQKEPSEYFAVCAECSSVFSVSKNFMREKARGTFCIMTDSDLKVLVNGNGKE